jgi:hypothetical protein
VSYVSKFNRKLNLGYNKQDKSSFKVQVQSLH